MKPRGVFSIVEFENPNKSTSYRVTGTKLSGERIRENFPTEAEALGRKQGLEIEAANFIPDKRITTTRLTPQQEADAERAFAELGDVPIMVAIRFFQDNYREPKTKMTVKDAFDKFLAEKQAANLRPLSITNLRVKMLSLLKEHGAKLVSEITPDICKDLIFLPTRSPKTRNNVRRAMSSFFGWCEAQGYTPASPIAKITPVKVERGDPKILTVAQARAVMSAAAAHKDGILLPYFALALFGGLRPTELARLPWTAISMKKQTITIGADVAKMRAKRTVDMSDNLVQWLLPFAVKRPPIAGVNWRRDFDAVKMAAGFGNPKLKRKNETPEQEKARKALKPWTPDILRHTAVSFKLADTQHEGQTAMWAGNSPDIIQAHYKGLVEHEDAKEFWEIRPEAQSGRKIVAFSTARA